MAPGRHPVPCGGGLACGIIAGDGADPLERWRSRLTWLGSEDVTGNVRALLRGEPVESVSGLLEISWQALAADRMRASRR